MDSNHRNRTIADLQSAPFDRSGTYPFYFADHRSGVRGHFTRFYYSLQAFFCIFLIFFANRLIFLHIGIYQKGYTEGKDTE